MKTKEEFNNLTGNIIHAATERALGLLINFNTPLLKSGIRRKINHYFQK